LTITHIAYTYDRAGEMTLVTDFQGRATTFAYSTTSSSSGPKVTTTYANGTTAVETADDDNNETRAAMNIRC
jgi:hypothetical protein